MIRTPYIRRPSPAMVVALAALFISLGGTSYAALKLPRNSVGPLQLKNGAVTRPKIARNAVDASKVRANALTGRVINEATLASVPSAEAAGTAERAATAADADRAAEAPIARVEYRSSSTALSSSGTTHSVSCLTGSVPVGGGAQVSDDTNGVVNDSNPVGRTGWEATGFRNPSVTVNMTVHVICAPAKVTAP